MGGEQSGHIILNDYNTTGDGLIAAMEVLAVIVQSGKRTSEVGRMFTPMPQLLQNVRFNGVSPLDDEAVKSAVRHAETRLGNDGRLLIRKSGTEPLVRVMAEGNDETLIKDVVDNIVGAMESAVG